MEQTKTNINAANEIHKNESFIKRNRSFIPAIAAIIGLFVVGNIISNGGFAQPNNISQNIAQASVLAIVAIGQSLIIFVGGGGIDLSLGAIMSMGAMLMPILSGGENAGIPGAMILIILFAGLAGLVNGIGVQLIRIPPLAMTLVMGTVMDGFTLAYSRGTPALTVPPMLKTMGQPLFMQVRTIIVVAVVATVIMQLILSKSSYGKSLFLVGSNRKAAALSGINVNLTVILAYVFAAMIAGFAGCMLVGYVGSGQLHMGETYTMLSIAAVVIGGATLTGGSGSLVGSYLGSVVIILLTNILVTAGLSFGVRQLFQGVILVVILLINSRSAKMRQ